MACEKLSPLPRSLFQRIRTSSPKSAFDQATLCDQSFETDARRNQLSTSTRATDSAGIYSTRAIRKTTEQGEKMQACDRCHARKTRCDRRIPQCSACERAGAPCLHADKLRQRNLPRDYIDSMETMVQKLRQENNNLRRALSTCQDNLAKYQDADPDPQRAGEDDGVSPVPSTTIVSPAARPIQSDTGSLDTPTPASAGGKLENVFALEVGYLSLNATGETRYLGSSSGVGLATIISKVLGGSSLLSAAESSHDGNESRRGLDNATSMDGGVFPSRAVATHLVEMYFQHTHITFPLLHRPSFEDKFERIYSEPGYYDSNPSEAFTFDMVLAIGASNVNCFGESAAGASAYYAAAQTKVSRMLNLDGLTTLKAILLLSQHGIFSNLRDTSGNTWHLIGIGARICIELGLHLKRRSLDDNPNPVSVNEHNISGEEEMRRRCFWCLYNLDR